MGYNDGGVEARDPINISGMDIGSGGFDKKRKIMTY